MDNQNGNKDNNKNNKQGFSFVILITMLTLFGICYVSVSGSGQ